MKYPISLEKSGRHPMPEMKMGDNDYPMLHLHWDKEYELPENGEMVVKFHKWSQTDTETDGKVSQSVDLHILSIESVKKDKEPPKKSARAEAEDALDAAKAEMEDVDDSAYV